MPKEPSYIDENFSFSSEDDDDDAPAEVSSSTIKKDKLSQVKSLRLQDKEAKEKVKEKRRKRDEMFKSQKEQKLKTFGKRALPDDVLQAVSSKASKINDESDEGINVKEADGDDSIDEDDRLSGSDLDDFDLSKDDAADDFISLDAGTQSVKVVTVNASKKNKSSLENALAFKQNQLFNQPGQAPPRETANQRRGRLMKKKQLHAKTH